MVPVSHASEKACRIPDDAIWDEETIRHELPSWYEAGVIWFNGLTLSDKYNADTDGSAIILIDYVKVIEQCNSQENIVLLQEYDSVPDSAQWWGWYYRNPWFGNDDAHDILTDYTISDGILTILVQERPDRVAHWWTERFPVYSNCTYFAEVRFMVIGDASLIVGSDWWIDMSSDWNGYDETCITSNNCEAWFSDWFSDTNDGFVTIKAPLNNYCEDIPDDDVDDDGFAYDTDCNDNDPTIYPGATETIADGVDQNCDGQEICFADADNDGYRPDLTSTVVSADLDCNNFGEAIATDPSGDCDDSNASIHPGATEVCDGIDNNCDGQIDEGVMLTWYLDSDQDGYGDPANSIEQCNQAAGYVADDNDCNDADALEHPNQTWFKDVDGDGYSDGTTMVSCLRPENYYVASELTSTTGDPDDTDPDIIPSDFPWPMFMPAIQTQNQQ